MQFSYVYILQSQAIPEHFYIGLTDDLHERLRRHNVAKCLTRANLYLGE